MNQWPPAKDPSPLYLHANADRMRSVLSQNTHTHDMHLFTRALSYSDNTPTHTNTQNIMAFFGRTVSCCFCRRVGCRWSERRARERDEYVRACRVVDVESPAKYSSHTPTECTPPRGRIDVSPMHRHTRTHARTHAHT